MHVPDQPGSSARRRALPNSLAVALLLGAAVLPQLPSFRYHFNSYDDYNSIVELTLIRKLDLQAVVEIFTPTPRPDLPEYMPLKNLSYAVDYALFGGSASAFRPQQWLWYALTTLLLWGWLRVFLAQLSAAGRLGLRDGAAPWLAFFSALLYALHPVHAESVTWLSGRKDLLSGAFSWAAMLCALRWPGGLRQKTGWLLGALGCTALALLGKPMAVSLPGLLLLQDLLLHERSSWPAVLRRRAALYVGAAALVLGFTLLYAHQTGGLHTEIPRAFQWRVYRGPSWLRWGQQLGAFLGLCATPSELVPLYPPTIFSVALWSVRGVGGLLLLTAALLYGALGSWRRQLPAFCLSAFTLSLLPILLFPPWAQYVAGRYLYVAVAFAILALVWLLCWLHERAQRMAPAVVAVGVLIASVWTLSLVAYNRLWRDSYTLWSASAETYPQVAEFARQAGFAAFLEQRPVEGIGWLSRCVQLSPNHPDCLAELGARLMQTQPSQAEALLRRALPVDDGGRAHAQLGMLLARSGRATEGLTLYGHWLQTHQATYRQWMPLIGLALLASQPQLALTAARRTIVAMSVEDPAQPAPVAMLLPIATQLHDSALATRLQAAAHSCTRSDCFRSAMRW